MTRKSTEQIKKKVKTKNCDIIGAQYAFMLDCNQIEMERILLQHIGVKNTENLRKVLRVYVNGQKFHGSYTNM